VLKRKHIEVGGKRMFILDAAAGGMNMITVVLIYAVILGGFYFLFMRPQSKEKKRIQAMLAEMAVGDTVLTTSGFYGVLLDIDEESGVVIVEFGSNKNCRIPMQKAAVAQIEKAEDTTKTA
jgi:preprotein translocase subunit YajC